MSYTMNILFMAGVSAIVIKLLAYFLFNKNNENLEFLQKHMPLLIMVVLVFYLYKDLEYAKLSSLSYVIAGFSALIIQILFKKSYFSIITATIIFYILKEIIFKV